MKDLFKVYYINKMPRFKIKIATFFVALTIVNICCVPLNKNNSITLGGIGTLTANKPTNTFNYENPKNSSHSQNATTTKANALLDAFRQLLRGEKIPIGAAQMNAAYNFATQSFGNQDGYIVSSRNQDNDVFKQTGNRTLNDQNIQKNQTLHLMKSTTTTCDCGVSPFKNAFDQFNRPDFSFKSSQVGDMPQKFAISDTYTCRFSDWSELCGAPKLKFTISDSNQELTEFPYKGLSWEENALEFTLQPTSDSDLGDHSVTMAILHQSHPTVVFQIAFKIAPTSTEHRNLQLPNQKSPCTGSTTNLNLLNSSVLASQSGYLIGTNNHNTAANQGCDGVLQYWNVVNGNAKRVIVQPIVQPSAGVRYWVAQFPISMWIQSILFFECDNTTMYVKFLVGDDNTSNYGNNPECTAGQQTTSGWFTCARQGKYFVITTVTAPTYFSFFEVMAYSQEYIQHNAMTSILSSTMTTSGTPYLCTTGANCQASNLMQAKLVIWNDMPRIQPCCIYSDMETDPTLKVTIKADVLIEIVILIPSDQRYSSVTAWQTNVDIYIVDIAGVQNLCGHLTDYNLYKEVSCNKVGNQIMVKRPGIGVTLAMAGLSILSSCDCSKTSFNPALIVAQPPFATTLNTTSMSPTISIQFNKQMPDTVSSVCGIADGFSSCARVFSFKDTSTGLPVTFPWQGFDFNAATTILTLDPSKANATCQLTVTGQMVNFPAISLSQDFTFNVQGGIAPVVVVQQTPIKFTESSALVQIVAPIQPVKVQPYPLILSDMSLNSTIHQAAYLELPPLDAVYSYSVTSKQTFEAQVDGNQLKVLSNNEIDVGIQSLDLVATSSSSKASFKVKITFRAPSTINDTQIVSSSTNVNLPNDLADQIDRVTCNDDGVCEDPTNSRFTCQFDDANSPMLCGLELDLKYNTDSKSKANTQKPMTMEVSEVSIQALLELTFSDSIDFQSLINTTHNDTFNCASTTAHCATQLKSQTGGGSADIGQSTGQNHSVYPEANSTDFDRSKYLLSNRHLNITIKPSLDHEDLSKLQFEWFAVNITKTKIVIQILFQYPTYVSPDYRNLDFLIIKLRPALLVMLKSQQTGLTIANLHQTHKRRLRKQLKLGKVTDFLEEVSKDSRIAAQLVVLGNFFVSFLLKGILSSMFTMVNSFQMLMALCYTVLAMPANVVLVMTQINTIAGFNYLPTEWMLNFCFDFSKTEMPFPSFQDMGVMSMRLTVILASFMVFIFLICVQSLLFIISWPLTNKFKLAKRYHRMMRRNYYWRGIIRLFLESYFDLCIAIQFSLREPRFDKPSDIFDFVLTLFFVFVLFTGPIASFFLMRKYSNQLDQEWFEKKYGSLTEGYYTTGVLGSQATRNTIFWFFLKRMLTALALVQLGNQNPVFQIGAILLLALVDLIMNFHLNAYATKMTSYMAKMNDSIVLLLSYFPILYAGSINDPEQAYLIGWAQCALVGIMFWANLAAVIKTTISEMMEECRRVRVERHNFRMLKYYGYDIAIVMQSGWETLVRLITRLLTIDWAFFDVMPARLSVLIAPYVARFQHQQAENFVDQADEIQYYVDLNADRNAAIEEIARSEQINPNDELSDFRSQQQISDYTFGSIVSKDHAVEIVEEIVLVPEVCHNVELEKQPNEITPTRNQNTNNKVMPAKKDVQKPAELINRNRAAIIEETQEQKTDDLAKQQKLKAYIFNKILKLLAAVRDPIVQNAQRNLEAQSLTNLLPDDIGQMSEKDQKHEVKNLLIVIAASEDISDKTQAQEIKQKKMPAKSNLDTNESQLVPYESPRQKQRQLYQHKVHVANMTAMEDLLVNEIEEKVAAFDELTQLARFHEERAERVPKYQRNIAIVDAYQLKVLADEQEIEIQKDVKVAKRLAADKAYHQAEVKRLSKSPERHR